MRIRIPESFYPAIANLLRLQPESVDRLIEVLSSGEPVLASRQLRDRVAQASELASGDAQQLVNFLLGLHVQRQRQLDWGGVSLINFVEAVCDAIEATGEEDLRIDDREKVEAQLAKLLDPESTTAISAKASDVLYERERLLQSARIVTDIRPVFGDDPRTGLEGAMLVHSLNIEYLDAAEIRVKSFQVALDHDDVKMLQRILERALQKEDSLVGRLRSAQVRLIEPPDPGGDD